MKYKDLTNRDKLTIIGLIVIFIIHVLILT